MPKQGTGPAKGPPKKKVKVLKETTRQKFTCEQKNHARDLKKDGKQPHEIIKIFKEIYDVEVKPSTLATWYNTKNMETHELRGSRNTSMASVETHVNPTQRPTIMIDMEFALVGMIKKANNIGTVTTKGTLKKMGKGIFNKLRALNIYDDPGERLRPLSELNEDQMNTLLADASKDRILCPLCEAPLRSGSDNSLVVHIQNYHSNRDDEQIPSPPGGNEFTFKGSDGWVRNFLDRHNMHNVLTVGEMGSNNQEASSPKMKEYPEKKEHHNEDRNPVFNQLETHKEHRNECSTEIEQFETDSSFDNENSVDTHKGSDVELDTQSDVQSERNIKENHVDQGFQSNLEKLSRKKELDDLFKDYRKKRSLYKEKQKTKDSSFISNKTNFNVEKYSTKIKDCQEIKGNHIDAKYECSVRLKRLETSNIFNKPSNVDQHKNHDFELDKQSDVELNEKSDGELDIDCIRNYLNTLPCTPGGNCSCDTDFTSQIPEYIIDLFNMMPDNNIIIVDNDKIIYL